MNQSDAWDLACIYEDAVDSWSTDLEDAKGQDQVLIPRFFGCTRMEPRQIQGLPQELANRLQADLK